ncbi:MAG: hypothetical protein LBG28_07975, partial [Tannerella sp.]|nr:hypothetical protein [Tannerella sp.]
ERYTDKKDVSIVNANTFDADGIRWMLMRFFNTHFSGINVSGVNVEHKNLIIMEMSIFRLDSS